MAFDPHTNLSYGLIDTAPSPALSGTSLTLQFGQGAFFDDPGVVGAYNVTAWPADNQPLQTNAEILRVTARVGDVFTVIRAQEGTPARAIAVGWAFAQTITAKVITDIETAIPSVAGLLSAINVSAGTTSHNLSALTFSNGNGVSFGLNGSTITATVATNYQASGAYLTTAALSQDSSKYAGTNGAITGGSITVNTSGVSVNLPAYLTTAALSQDSSRYAGTNGAITGGSITVNTSGVSVNLPAYLTTAMASNAVTLSNIRVSAGTTSNLLSALTFANGGGVSFGLDGSTLTASAPAAGGGLALSLSGNTAGVLALVSTGTVILAGGNNITVSQNGQSVTISGANVGGAQTGISGIAGSNTTYTSGTVIFTGVGGGITVSSNTGQRLDFSVGAYITTARASTDAIGLNTAQTNVTWTVNSAGLSLNAGGYAGTGFTSTTTAGTQVKATNNTAGLSMAVPAVLTTAMASNAVTLSNIRVSAGTTSNLLSAITFSNSNGLAFGLDAGTVTGSYTVPTQTVQTQNLVAVSLSGNTAGVLALVSSGTVILAGGNNITVSQNGQSVTISGANIGGAQTGISGIVVSDATYTSGTVSFSNAGNITISSSVNGATQYIRLSGNAAQTAQTQSNIQAIYDGANSISTGTIRFTNANGVSFSVNGQTLSGSVATTYLASNASTNYVQANAVFNGTNASGTIASNAISVSVAAPAGSSWTVSDAATSGTVGRLAFTNLNGVTLSLSTGAAGLHTIVGSHNALTTQSTQFLALTLGGNSAGTSTFHATNNASLFLNGGQGITLSGNGSTITFSVGSYITTAMASNRGSDFVQANAAFAGTNASGTIASSGISVSVATALTSQSTQYLAMTLGGNTAGTTTFHATNNASLFLNGGQGITLSGNGSTVTFSVGSYITTARASTDAVGLATAQTNVTWTVNSAGLSLNAGGYAGTGFTSTTTAGTDIKATQNTAGLSMAVPAFLTTAGAVQTNQTLGLYGVGNTTGESSSSTFDARTLSFNGAGNVSVGYSAGSVVISGGSAAPSPVNFSAGTTSGNLGSVVFSDSNGISFGLNGSTITANANTVGTATTVYPVASANSVGTALRWAAEDHRHAGIGGIGISTGNTAGDTGSVVGTYWFQGSNLTVSQITSNNGSHTLVLSAAGGAGATASMWPHPLPGSTTVSSYYSGSTSSGGGGNSTLSGYTHSLYIVPMVLHEAVAFSQLRLGVSNTRSTAGTGSVTHLYSVGLYTNNASTLSLVKAYYGGLFLSQNSVTAQTFSLFTFSTGGATAGGGGGYAGLAVSTHYSSAGNISANSQMDGAPGVKLVRVDDGIATTFPAGQYYCALGFVSKSSSVNVYSCVGIWQSAQMSSINLPDLGRENSTQSSNWLPAWGAISTTYTSASNAASFFPLPNAIAISDMTVTQATAYRHHFPFMKNHT